MGAVCVIIPMYLSVGSFFYLIRLPFFDNSVGAVSGSPHSETCHAISPRRDSCHLVDFSKDFKIVIDLKDHDNQSVDIK